MMFRQQAAGNPDTDWFKFNPILYAVFSCMQVGTGKNCILYMESDHSEEDCALSKARGSTSHKQAATENKDNRQDSWGRTLNWGKGSCYTN